MACRTIAAGAGGVIIACDRSRSKPCDTPGCGGSSVALCDYPVIRKGKKATCDAKLCGRCRQVQGPNKDYCIPHAKLAPAVGDRRVHISSGALLYVLNVRETLGGDTEITYATPGPSGDPDLGFISGPYTVSLVKWLERTRPF